MFNYIYIEITNTCQFNCSFCPKTKRKKKEMSLDEFETILKKIKGYTKNIYLHVLGEPLLHQHLDGILKIANDYDFTVHITTNALLIKEKTSILKKYDNIRKINMSLHSVEDLAQVKINRADYFQNILDFIAQKPENSTVILRLWNLDKSKNVIVNMINDHFNTDIKNHVTTPAGIKISNKVFLSQDNLFEWPIENLSNDYQKNGFCLGLKSHIAILSCGTVVPCCLDSEGLMKLGNIYEESLENILNNELSQNIRNHFQNNKSYTEVCKKCTYKNRFLK